MRYTIDVHPGYIKAEMRERETSEETHTFVTALLAALRQHNTARVLISVRESRPVFKVEDWGFSDAIAKVLGTGLRVAFIADSKEVAMSQEYIALLGRQKGLDFRSFADEAEAAQWLQGAASAARDGAG
jgi:stage II sporulation SpoAA-like protein